MGTLKLELPSRPEADAADLQHEQRVMKQEGPKHFGHVVVISQEVGVGYVVDDATSVRYSIARRYVPQFDSLKQGERIEFYDNGQNAVSAIG